MIDLWCIETSRYSSSLLRFSSLTLHLLNNEQPENLLYSSHDSDACVKLSDFGLSKFSNEKDNEGLQTPCGTIAYTGMIEGEERQGVRDKWREETAEGICSNSYFST